MMIINFVTSNKNKVLEAQARLGAGFCVRQWDVDCPEIQADTLEEVALASAQHVIEKHAPKEAFILEDAGLFVDALKGFPGPYSHFVHDTLDCKGILKLLESANGKGRNARFEAVLVYTVPGKKPALFKGICRGKIAESQAGKNGFGFDPIFVPDGESRRFAEMKPEEKGKYSHRGLALGAFANYVKSLKV
ncbi:MAG: RdgB/HAM1 family non-canonical purine NTP pyrophosphatase [Candidatus Thermoplasmatota archaeon]|nr:RdgB/HAM1 family non-canonical purine NTP pyrophosphatase [Candidatus Thermoplasmatota archaeon]